MRDYAILTKRAYNSDLFRDAQRGANLLVGAARHQHLEHFLLAVGECDAARRENPSRGRAHALDEHGKHMARGPDRTLMNHAYGLHKVSRSGSLVHVALGPG